MKIRKIYVGPRKSGKTYTMLNRSQETGLPVLVPDWKMKKHLEDEANKLGLEGVTVITVDDLNKHPSTREVIVDEGQALLERLLKVNVVEISMSAPSITHLQHIFNTSIGIR